MAEPTQITQEPITAPPAIVVAPPVQTPAPVQNIAPVTHPVTPPAPPPVPVIPGAHVTPAQPQIIVQPITTETAAQLTVDMNSLTAAVDKAYGRE